MPSMFNRAFANFAKSKIDRTFGIEADYIRGNECFSVTVLADPTLFRVETEAGDVVGFKTFDFLIDQCAEPFQGAYAVPQRKDKLQLIVNERKRTFELLPDIGEQHFEEDDSLGIRFRLRTKEKPS